MISEQEQGEQQDKELIGPGQQLAYARQAHQMTQEEIAQKLCLSLQLVRDIERDEYKQKINVVFLRGYLRSYARLVGLLPDQVVGAFDKLHSQETQNASVSAPIPQGHARVLCDAKVKLPGKKIKWVSYLVCLILVLLAIVWWHDYSKMQKKAAAFNDENSSLNSNANTEQSQPIDIQYSSPAEHSEPEIKKE